MSIISLVTIKSYFERGDKPTQKEFSDTWDSYWHKHQIGGISLWGEGNESPWKAGNPFSININRIVDGASVEYSPPIVIPEGSFSVHKSPGKEGNYIELGDIIIGFVSLQTGLLFGWWQYSGTNPSDLTGSYTEVYSVEVSGLLPVTPLPNSPNQPFIRLSGILIEKISGNENYSIPEAGDIGMFGRLSDGSYMSYGEFKGGNLPANSPNSWNNLITRFDPIEPDITAPIITLTGSNPQTIELGSPYVELGATTDDNSPVVIDSSAFSNSLGSYNITYNASDASGNSATEVIRVVNVVDNVLPYTLPFTLEI